MAEEKELTKIERELALQYLRDDNVPLTVTLEDKPEMAEAEMKEGSVPAPQREGRIPASAVFPVAIPSRQITVLDKGVILLKNAARTVQPFLGRKVRVQFYFHHLGLYFITEMRECSQGLAIEVPSSIRRIPDIPSRINYDFCGTVSYEVSNSTVSMDWMPIQGYRLFSQPRWDDIDPSRHVEAKALLERFVAEVKSGATGPIGNGIQLIPIARFLTERSLPGGEAIEGRKKPFGVVYVDDRRIVLSATENCESLSGDHGYKVSMTFTLSENRLLKRRLDAECSVENVYENEAAPGARCYSLRYSVMKEEDSRFLYERIRGRMFGT